MQSNINRLALTFGRPVLGVHNKTSGVIFDVLQCLIQRNFNYATMDIRDGYKIVKSTLYNPNLTKVIKQLSPPSLNHFIIAPQNTYLFYIHTEKPPD